MPGQQVLADHIRLCDNKFCTLFIHMAICINFVNIVIWMFLELVLVMH